MSGFKLYEISEELMTLEDMLYDDTVDQETVQDTLEMINMDFEDKADNYAKIIRTMDASIKALKDEEQRLSGRRKALEERQKWLKDTLEANMRYTGKMKFKTPLFSFSIQKNGGLEPLVITGELEDIPGRYLIQQPPIPVNMKIRKLLEEQPVEWAHLEPRGESLRIR